MGDTVKKNTAYAVEIEVTEGTYVAPSGSSSFVQTLTDGAELNPSKELLERNVFTGSIGKVSPLTGQFQVSGSLPMEARANSTEGSAPECDKLMKAALGTRRQNTTVITTKTGNSASVLQIEDADISKMSIGDIILIKEAGAFHVSPITAKSTGTGTATVTLLVPRASSTFPDSVTIAKFTTYKVADSGHPSLSVSKYVENAVREYAVGCHVNSMSLDNFSTGQIPSFNFAFEGLNYDRSVSAIPYTPSYDTSLPPIILDSHVYQNGTDIEVNELTLSLENTVAFKTATKNSNGRSSGRATERTISGSFNPFKPDNSVAQYTKYLNNTAFSLFAYAKVPTGVSGEFGNIIAVYMPNCIITELAEGDQDGILQDAINFSANRGTAGSTDELYITFI